MFYLFKRHIPDNWPVEKKIFYSKSRLYDLESRDVVQNYVGYLDMFLQRSPTWKFNFRKQFHCGYKVKIKLKL
jgi:hypothetical protein